MKLHTIPAIPSKEVLFLAFVCICAFHRGNVELHEMHFRDTKRNRVLGWPGCKVVQQKVSLAINDIQKTLEWIVPQVISAWKTKHSMYCECVRIYFTANPQVLVGTEFGTSHSNIIFILGATKMLKTCTTMFCHLIGDAFTFSRFFSAVTLQ